MDIFKSSATVKRVQKILGWSGGGVHKRIDENRELLELLQKEAPDFLKSHFWVEGRLKSNDEFFCDLAAAVEISEGRFLGQVKSYGTPFPRPWPISNQATNVVSKSEAPDLTQAISSEDELKCTWLLRLPQ